MGRNNSSCLFCNKKFYCKPSNISYGGGKYCSRECSGKSKRTGKNIKCLVCQKIKWRAPSELKKHGNGAYFCSTGCANKYNNKKRSGDKHHNWRDGYSSYRARAIGEFGLICASKEKCPLKDMTLPELMYDVHHIDFDRSNNESENLEVLCLWCHRIITLDRLKID